MRFPLRTQRPQRQTISSAAQLVAPYRGLNTRDPLDRMRQGYASVLQNFWPTGVSVTSRPGATAHVTGFAAPVKTLATYEGVIGTPKMFAFTDAGTYAVTSAGAVGASLLARTNGRHRTVQYRNSAGTFLFAVNGTDDLAQYDGSSWSTVANFTIGAGSGTGTKDTKLFTGTEVHQRRVWFIEKDTADAWYLGTDLVSGEINLFRIGAQFALGGYLIAIATWSLDSGSGPDDLLAFVSSKGQVAVYSGLDPSDPDQWSLRGVYTVAPPIGRRCVHKVGGDLLLLTTSGIFSMNAILHGESSINTPPLTDIIAPTFNAAAASYGTLDGWQAQTFASENMLLVNAPTKADASARQFAVHLLSGAWTTFNGWDALCWEVLGSDLYFGGTTAVYRAWVDPSNDPGDTPIVSKARLAYTTFGGAGANKRVHSVKPHITYTGSASLQVGFDVDFRTTSTMYPSAAGSTTSSVFDTATFDSSGWAGLDVSLANWTTLPASIGRSFAPRVQAVSTDGRIAWSAIDFLYESGGLFG